MNEMRSLLALLPQMSRVLNLNQGDIFSFKESQLLEVLERRFPDSELKRALKEYNEVFIGEQGVDLEQIKRCVLAYAKIQILVKYELFNFHPESQRDLIKEYQNGLRKSQNILHLSEINILTAEEYQKETVRKTLEKNKILQSAYLDAIEELESKIQRLENDNLGKR